MELILLVQVPHRPPPSLRRPWDRSIHVRYLSSACITTRQAS